MIAPVVDIVVVVEDFVVVVVVVTQRGRLNKHH
jgi:hypothetical protein